MNMSANDMQKAYQEYTAAFEGWKAKNLKLNMARGKPSKAQLDTVNGILNILVDPAECFVDGVDARN